MEMRHKIPAIISISDTEPVAAHNKLCPFSCAHGITVYSHNTRYSAAICLHVGRRIVGFTGNNVIVIIVKTRNTGIIPQNRHNPRLFLL